MIAGVLLAAGKSSRFGADKLRHPLPDGVPIGVAAARNLCSALPYSVAVIPAGNHLLEEQLATSGIGMAVNPEADAGMGRSLACGVAATREADGWLIALADMPFIRPSTILSVASLVTTREIIVRPEYRGRAGHPVGFGRGYLGRLLELSADKGAHTIVRANGDRLAILKTDDAGILLDIDYPEDLAT